MTSPTPNSDLHGLFHEAVADVHAENGPDQIRARAARRTSPGRWLPLTLAAAVATVMVIGGAAWLAGRQPDTPAAGPGGPVQEPTSQTSAEPGRTAQVLVYYLGATAAGPRLFSETHTIEDTTDTDAQVAVQEALGGAPADADYQNHFRELGVTARVVQDQGGPLTVDFSEPVPRPDGMDDDTASMALQSLVWTAGAAVSGSPAVQFTVDGSPARDQVLGLDLGVDGPGNPVERLPADNALATVSIATPAEGATVPTEFEVTGQAATFEANVVWELKQGDDVVREGFTTASECCTLAPYSFTVSAPPGKYTLHVHDTDMSDGEGVGTSEDTKNITVQ